MKKANARMTPLFIRLPKDRLSWRVLYLFDLLSFFELLHTNRPLSTSRSIYLLYSYQCTIYVYCPSAAIRSFSCKQPHDRNVHNSTIISIRRPLASCISLVTRDSLARISALSTLWYRSVCGQLKVNRSLRNKCVKVCHLTELVVYLRS